MLPRPRPATRLAAWAGPALFAGLFTVGAIACRDTRVELGPAPRLPEEGSDNDSDSAPNVACPTPTSADLTFRLEARDDEGPCSVCSGSGMELAVVVANPCDVSLPLETTQRRLYSSYSYVHTGTGDSAQASGGHGGATSWEVPAHGQVEDLITMMTPTDPGVWRAEVRFTDDAETERGLRFTVE